MDYSIKGAEKVKKNNHLNLHLPAAHFSLTGTLETMLGTAYTCC